MRKDIRDGGSCASRGGGRRLWVASGGHVEKDFGRSKGAEATGIQHAWQGRGRGGGGWSRVVMGERRDRDGVFSYAGTQTGDAQVGG